MVWAEPTGLELLIPGDRDPSASPSVDSRDYIRITGDLPPELLPYMNTAILYYNGKYDPTFTGAQLKYYGTGVGSGAGAIGSAFTFYYIENYGDIPGNTRLVTVNSSSIEVQSAARKVYVNLGSNDNNIDQQLTARSPLSDQLNGPTEYPVNTNYIIDGVQRTVLGSPLGGWTQDPNREQISIYKDVTGRCWLNGSLRSPEPVANGVAILQLATSGPWAPVTNNGKVRYWSVPIYKEQDGYAYAATVYFSPGDNKLYFIGPNNINYNFAVWISLAGITFHTNTKLFGT